MCEVHTTGIKKVQIYNSFPLKYDTADVLTECTKLYEYIAYMQPYHQLYIYIRELSARFQQYSGISDLGRRLHGLHSQFMWEI